MVIRKLLGELLGKTVRYDITIKSKNQVAKVSPGGLLPGDEGSEGHVILGFRVPTTSELKKFDDNR